MGIFQMAVIFVILQKTAQDICCKIIHCSVQQCFTSKMLAIVNLS